MMIEAKFDYETIDAHQGEEGEKHWQPTIEASAKQLAEVKDHLTVVSASNKNRPALLGS